MKARWRRCARSADAAPLSAFCCCRASRRALADAAALRVGARGRPSP
jgi:hypothetical protein